MRYNVHICGTVDDGTKNGFKMGFDTFVENGGNVLQIAAAIQEAIDTIVSETTDIISQN